jgi:hypothetical protein
MAREISGWRKIWTSVNLYFFFAHSMSSPLEILNLNYVPLKELKGIINKKAIWASSLECGK